MANLIQFAVLQKETTGPTAEQLKRVFKSFSNLTDADAVRLAVGSRGILMKHLGQEAARALQRALQAEGIPAAIVAHNDLPKLPEPLSLSRMELWPQVLTVYDPAGRPSAIACQDIALVAAGAAQHLELNKTQTEFIRLQMNTDLGLRSKGQGDKRHSIDSGSQLVLEIILGAGAARYEIDAAQFAFKHVIDRPGLATEEKFIWLVRELCRHTTQATLNSGALRLSQGQNSVPAYTNRQVLTDEIVWLLWQGSRNQRP